VESEQLRGFLEHVRDDPLYAAWPLFTTTGMRRGEVAGLRWPDGRPIHPERFSRWFEQHARDAGLPKIRLHDVRHSYASAALAAGVPAKVVSERLGHANIAITMDTCSHVLPGLDAQAADTVARLILGDGDQEPTRPVDKPLTEGGKAAGRGGERR
jgi:integrase